MKANELRIGNLVYAFKTTWQVDNTCFSNIELMETYKPIPITEEWLIKFGFFKVDYFGNGTYLRLLIDEMAISIEMSNNEILDVGASTGESTLHLNIKYVHQLQNLYFALTGEELTVKQEL